MEYKIEKDRIIIIGKEDFCPKHILECGQIFSYVKESNNYIVYSKDNVAKIIETNIGFDILTNSPEYFENFFDLETNYSKIKNELINKHKFLENIISFGYGIRILNQDIFETIISFIVSANNNIKRIQKILFEFRKNYGTNMGTYYAFPTIQQLKKATEEDFKQMGAGYRATYLYKVIRQLELENYESWNELPVEKLNEKLLSLMGVGQKVSDCIMLFSYGKKRVFPVDTWIEKVYCKYFKQEDNRIKIRQHLLETFDGLSGYAQQYLFYSQRSDN